MTTFEAANRLISECEARGIVLRLGNKAVTTDSVYLKFDDERLRSVTVRTHPTKKKYRYKWNLYKAWQGPRKVSDRGVTRFYFPFSRISEMADRIEQYLATIQNNEDGDL